MATKLVAAIVLILSLTACSDHSGSTGLTSASPTAAETTGTLTGLVRMHGGALNPQTGKQALNGSPGPHERVRVLQSGTQTVAEANSDAAGKFRFTLAPGRYTLACSLEPRVVVVTGRTVSVDCDLDVP